MLRTAALVVLVAAAALAYDASTFSQYDQMCDSLLEDGKTQDDCDDLDSLYKNKLYEAFEGQKNCAITGFAPTKPRSLSFCHKFNDNACCPPTLDMENNEMFDSMFDLGLSCRLRGDVRENPIAKLYCINCDPQQPRYVREVTNPDHGKPKTMLVCRSWAEAELVLDPLLEPFNRCGLMVSATCLDATETAIPGRDRYLCGDDLLIPGDALLGEDDPLEAFINYENLGPPALDEDFYFKLVDSRACTGADATAGTDDNPDCLMTADQVAARLGAPSTSAARAAACANRAYRADNNTAGHCVEFQPELCFNSASSISVSLSLVLAVVFAAVALFH